MALKIYPMPCGKLYVNESPYEETFYIKDQAVTLQPKQVRFVGGTPTDLIQYLVSPSLWESKKQFDELLEKKGHVEVLMDISKVDRWGDHILFTILPKAYKESHKQNVDVDVLVPVQFVDAWKNNPFVRSVIAYGTPRPTIVYGINIDLNNLEPKFRAKGECSTAILQHAGLSLINRTPVYIVSDEEKAWAQNYLFKVERPLVGIQMESFAKIRTYPHMKKVAKILSKKYSVCGLDLREDNGNHVFSLREMAALINECDIVVANDSGVIHLAGALKKRVFGVFGHTAGEVVMENYEHGTAIKSTTCPKAPCWWEVPCVEGTSYRGKEASGFVKCLEDLKPEVVVEQIEAACTKVRKVFVAMLTFDLLSYTKMAVSSVRSWHDWQLFVVDNASTDGTQEWLKEQGIAHAVKRCSVAAAQNIAIDEFLKSDCDYFLLLNNDVVIHRDAIDTLVKQMEASPELWGLTSQEVVTAAPWLIDEQSTEKKGWFEIVDIPTSAYSCTVFTREAVEKIGKFDEWFTPRYIEDNDYTLRLRLLGGKFGKSNESLYWHLVGGVLSNSEVERHSRDIHWNKNILYYIEKWGIHPHEPQKLERLGEEHRRGAFVKAIDEALAVKSKIDVRVKQKLGGWGDAIFTTIVAKVLKREYGDRVAVHYDVMDRYKDFIRRYPYIATVNNGVSCDCQIELADTEFRVEWQECFLTGGIQSSRAAVYLNIAGLPEDDFKPDVFITDVERMWAKEQWGLRPKKVVICPEGSNSLKHWHGMAETADALKQMGCNVIVSDNKYSFTGMCAIIAEADLVISPDTGLSNVAGALDIPAITLFSNRNKAPFERIFPSMIGIQGHCQYHLSGFCDYKMYCTGTEGPYRTKEQKFIESDCFQNLDVSEVLAVAREVLGC